MRFHFDRLSPSSLISLKLSLDRPRISGPPLSQVSLLTENGNTKDDLRLPTDDALLTQRESCSYNPTLRVIGPLNNKSLRSNLTFHDDGSINRRQRIRTCECCLASTPSCSNWVQPRKLDKLEINNRQRRLSKHYQSQCDDVYMYFRGSGKAAEMKREAAKRTMMAALP